LKCLKCAKVPQVLDSLPPSFIIARASGAVLNFRHFELLQLVRVKEYPMLYIASVTFVCCVAYLIFAIVDPERF